MKKYPINILFWGQKYWLGSKETCTKMLVGWRQTLSKNFRIVLLVIK